MKDLFCSFKDKRTQEDTQELNTKPTSINQLKIFTLHILQLWMYMGHQKIENMICKILLMLWNIFCSCS